MTLTVIKSLGAVTGLSNHPAIGCAAQYHDQTGTYQRTVIDDHDVIRGLLGFGGGSDLQSGVGLAPESGFTSR
jgi:hypothetical protein